MPSAWGTGGAARSCDALLKRVERNDPLLTDLAVLPSKDFGPAEVSRLANAVASGANTCLRSVSASGHALPPASLGELGRALSAQAERLTNAAAAKAEGGEVGVGGGVTSLAVGDGNIGDVGIEALCEGLALSRGALLERLDLGWKNLGPAGMRAVGAALGPSRRLVELDLSRNPGAGNAGLAALRDAALSSVANDGDGVVAALPFPRLARWDMSDCGVSGSGGTEALAEILLGSGGRDGSGEEGSGTTTTRRRDGPVEIALNSNAVGPEGCPALSALLTDGSAVASLALRGCGIGDVGLERIADGADRDGMSCAGVTSLDLSDCSLSTAGAERLGNSLSAGRWPDLSELKLAGNDLGGGGVLLIATALGGGAATKVRTLDLSGTNCGAEGAAAIIGCQLPSLSSLRLFDNKLGSEGFRAIAPLVRRATALRELDLGGNRADEEAVVALLDAIAEDDPGSECGLLILEMGGNDFGEKAEEALRRLIEARPNLDVAHDKPNVGDGDEEEGETDVTGETAFADLDQNEP